MFPSELIGMTLAILSLIRVLMCSFQSWLSQSMSWSSTLIFSSSLSDRLMIPRYSLRICVCFSLSFILSPIGVCGNICSRSSLCDLKYLAGSLVSLVAERMLMISSSVDTLTSLLSYHDSRKAVFSFSSSLLPDCLIRSS